MNYDPFVKEDFVLPEKWYCSYSNKEEFDIMNKFFKGNWGFVSIDGFNGCTNLSNCNHWFSRDKISDDIIKITFEQFKKYVLKEPIEHGNGILDAVESKQPSKQAVHCKTQEEWNFVLSKLPNSCLLSMQCGKFTELSNRYKYKNGIAVDIKHCLCSSIDWYKNDGYKILSFQEWCDLNGYKIEKEVKFEVGDYVILENAGGWSYSTFNDGCLGLITKIGNFKPSTVTDYICSISGNILNSNNKDTTFRDIPIAFYHRKWIVRHATPEEINQHLISIGQIPAGEPLNTGIEPNKDGMFKYKQTMPGSSWSGGTIDNHLDIMIQTTGNCYDEDFSKSFIPIKPKMTLSIDDEELPMVSITKTNSIKQLLNND